GRWHFITGRGRSSRGAAQPVAEAGEGPRRGGGEGNFGGGAGGGGGGGGGGRVCGGGGGKAPPRGGVRGQRRGGGGRGGGRGGEGVFWRGVNVDYASHSAEMAPILSELGSALSDLAPQAGQVPMVSTVTGARCEGTTLDGTYWCRNLRQTVRLDLALKELIGD